MSVIRKRERFKVMHIKVKSVEDACDHMTRVINSGGEILNILPDIDPVDGHCWNVFYVTLQFEGEIIEGIFTIEENNLKVISK